MKKFNLIDLEIGQNQILLDSSDLPLTQSRKFPIFRIPKGYWIIDASFRVLEPVEIFSNNNSAGGSASAYPVCSLGIDRDLEYFIKNTALNIVGDYSFLDTAEYFRKGQYQFDKETNVYFSAYTIPRVWSMAKRMSARRSRGSGLGTYHDCIAISGFNSSAGVGAVRQNTTELYNGVGWSSGPTYTDAAARGGHTAQGPMYDGILMGGSTAASQSIVKTSEYNVFSSDSHPEGVFTAGPDMNTARARPGSFGLANNIYISGGTVSSDDPVGLTTTEFYNGTAFSASSDMIVGRYGHGASGYNDKALVYAGNMIGASMTQTTEEWDGSIYTISTPFPKQTRYFACFGEGLKACANDRGSTFEFIDDTTWYAGSTSLISRYNHSGVGKIGAAIVFGGDMDKRSGEYRDVGLYSSLNLDQATTWEVEEYTEILRQSQISASGMIIINLTIR